MIYKRGKVYWYKFMWNGKPVQLTKREWELLEFFVENEGRLVPRQELLENIVNSYL